jgi:FixJ family two-component response regulator
METAQVQVVIVDDDPSVGRALGRLVRSLGMNAETYLSGEAFLRAIEVSGTPKCVVLDVQMPEMNGLDVQQRMAERELAVPVIFITAHEDHGVVERAIAAGAVGLLHKPFSEASFRSMICQALQRQA